MKNKFISVIMALVIVFSTFAMMSVSVSAAGMSFKVTEVSETPSTVTVAVSVSGNKGFNYLGANLVYDSSVLEFESVDTGRVADKAGMAVWDAEMEDGSINLTTSGGNGTKSNGEVFVATFKKNSSIKNGTTANISVSSIDDRTEDLNGGSLNISSADAKIRLDSTETTTRKPTTTKKTTTTNVEKTTNKVNQTEPVANEITLPTVPTTAETTTMEESTTLLVTEEWTEEEYTYESYSYAEPDNEAVEDDEADKSQKTKRIIAIVVIIVCVSAVAALIFTKKKSATESKK